MSPVEELDHEPGEASGHEHRQDLDHEGGQSWHRCAVFVPSCSYSQCDTTLTTGVTIRVAYWYGCNCAYFRSLTFVTTVTRVTTSSPSPPPPPLSGITS